MNAVNPNPYAPPATESFAEIPMPSMETLEESGPIPFSGSVEDQDLREFLRADGHVGCAYLTLLGFFVSLVSLVLLVQGGGLAGLAIGAIGLFLILTVVSTIPYRQLVFQNANPRWRQLSRGELRVDGVQIDRRDTQAFFRWDWYWNAVAGDNWVAFLPATQPMQPLFITRSMLQQLDDWQRLLQVAAAVASHADNLGEQQHRQQNSHLMQQQGRPRSVEVPEGAIAFDGILRANDLSRLPSSHRRREKPIRSYVVVASLLASGAFILAGTSNLIFQQFAFLPTLAVSYIVMASIGIAVRRKRRGSANQGVVFYLNAFATESSITSDFAITTTDVPWSTLQVVVRTDDLVAFQRRQWIQFIVARRDMFADDETWRNFQTLVDRAELQSFTAAD